MPAVLMMMMIMHRHRLLNIMPNHRFEGGRFAGSGDGAGLALVTAAPPACSESANIDFAARAATQGKIRRDRQNF
jgi:hypothetical protein